jgi:Na+-driven multidrug efflux pump
LLVITGAQNYERVKESIQISIKYAALLASLILFLYFTMQTPIVSVLPLIQKLFQRHRMLLVGYFAASHYCHPVNRAAHLSGGGNAKKALMLTLSKQGFSLNSIIILLPIFFGIFESGPPPIADVPSTTVTGYFLRKEMTTN